MTRRLLCACACVVGAVMLVGTPALGQSTLALTPLKVVLLGDSYSAGNGAGDYYGPHECYRSPNNWAERYIDALRTQGYAVTFVNRACSGGVTADIFNDRVDDDGFLRTRLSLDGQWSEDSPGLVELLDDRGYCEEKYPDEETLTIDVTSTEFSPATGLTWVELECDRTLEAQAAVIGDDTDLVLLTTGGNDAGFGSIVRRCFGVWFFFGPRDKTLCQQVVAAGQDTASGDTYRNDLESMLTRLAGSMRPDSRIALVTYPHIECCPDSYTFDGFPVGVEVRALGDIGEAAQRVAVDDSNTNTSSSHAVLVDGSKAVFAGHEPWGDPNEKNPNRWIYEIERGVPLSGGETAENYHPNPTGHEAWANLLIPRGTFGTTGRVGGGNIDVVFTIDTTGSMGDDIDAVKGFSNEFVNLLSARTLSYRFALVTYRDHPSRTGDPSDYPARVDLDFTDDAASITSAIDAIDVGGGGDFPETVYSGLMQSIGLEWRPGVKKIVLQLGDAPPLDPEPVTDYTADDVVDAALAVDPAEVYVLNVSGGAAPPALTDIADRTGGGVFSSPTPSEVAASLIAIVEEALAEPLAWAAGPYVTTVGTPVVLDGSGSIDPDGTIVSYEWDLNGDGEFDTSSAQPTRTHTFASAYDGIVSLRVTDDDGHTTVATARAHASVDGDELDAPVDNCPNQPNHGQLDVDGDGIGDVCDSTPGFELEGLAATCNGRAATIVGTQGDNVLTGTSGVDVIIGLGGNDSISGLDGADVLCGGSGNDRVLGGRGNDQLFGENGNDILEGGDNNDTVQGGSGNDIMRGEKGDDRLSDILGNDNFSGGPGTDWCGGSREGPYSGCEVVAVIR